MQRLAVAVGSPPAKGATHAVMLLDLNGFKRINDVYGHNAGDQALIIVAQRLLGTVREGDLVARLGGDEFAIVATQLPSSETATGLALRILEKLAEPFVVGKVEDQVSAGIGLCMLPFFCATSDEVLRRADVALYKAKAEGKSALPFFDESMDQQVRERDYLEREFSKALSQGKIRPYFQPLVDLSGNTIVGFEALARWTHETLGEVPPERFIAIAEDLGLIATLTDQLLLSACSTAKDWPDQTFLSFNLSAIELRNRQRGERILRILDQTEVSPRRLEIEITESALVRDMDAARVVLSTLRQAGVSVALDDFGTGYSSLYHLRNLKLDKIKIDRGFVNGMGKERESAEIVAAVVGLGKGLGLTVTAEGIENAGEEAHLRSLGCQQGQGFLFGRAVDADDTASLLAAQLSQDAPRSAMPADNAQI